MIDKIKSNIEQSEKTTHSPWDVLNVTLSTPHTTHVLSLKFFIFTFSSAPAPAPPDPIAFTGLTPFPPCMSACEGVDDPAAGTGAGGGTGSGGLVWDTRSHLMQNIICVTQRSYVVLCHAMICCAVI